MCISVEVKQFVIEARAAADAAAAMAQQMREAGGDLESVPGLMGSTQLLRSAVRPSGEGSSDSTDSNSGTVQQASRDKPFEPQVSDSSTNVWFVDLIFLLCLIFL